MDACPGGIRRRLAFMALVGGLVMAPATGLACDTEAGVMQEAPVESGSPGVLVPAVEALRGTVVGTQDGVVRLRVGS